MSRTFRRKGMLQRDAFALKDLVHLPGTFTWMWVTLPHNSKEWRRKRAEYHSDAGCGTYGNATAPRWYRRKCNKQFSLKELRELRKYLRDNEYTPIAKIRKNNASWYW